jgi:cysteine desulfurase / selenocysteine lyase
MMNEQEFEQFVQKAAELKLDFPLLNKTVNSKPLVYLDSAATTQKPQVVIDSLKDYYEQDNANVHRGVYSLSEKATLAFEQARGIVAKFINASTKEVVFTSGTTAAINSVSRMLESEVKVGDEIVISILEHHSNFVVWQQLAKRKKAVLKFSGLNKQNEMDLENAKKKNNF